MKRILLFICILASVSTFAQCVVDTTVTTVGIHPVNGTSSGFDVNLPDAYVGMMYAQELQIMAPADTTIDTLGTQLTAGIDSLKIVGFKNMPNGMQLTCNTSDCIIIGGKHGCADFFGTPTDTGQVSITAYIQGWINAGFFGTLSDTIEFTINYKVLPGMGVDEFISKSSVSVTPNPIQEIGEIQFTAKKNAAYTCKILDITGRTVRLEKGTTIPGQNSILVQRNNLPSGLYFYTIEIGSHAVTGKLTLAH